jgi:hypothetical protein
MPARCYSRRLDLLLLLLLVVVAVARSWVCLH